MLYPDVQHPINVARLLYDVLCVAVRSFSPETLVRKRVKRMPREDNDVSRGRRSSRLSSRAASANTSLNVSAQTAGQLPPPVPNRSATDVSRSSRRRRSSRSGQEHSEQKGWRHWRSIDVTKQMVMVMHVLRAAPVAVLRFFCQVQTDAETLPLLNYSDLSKAARDLLFLRADSVFAADFVVPFLTARFLLGLAQQYMMERVSFDTNLVVRNLRSRRWWRKALGWFLSLSSHIITDPIAFSILTPVLLNRVRDLSPVTGPLRYTPVGVTKGLVVGSLGVILELMIVPAASQLCQRAVVTVADAMEYLLLRRYARWGTGANGRGGHDTASNVNSEDEHWDGASSYAGSVNDSRLTNRKTAETGRSSRDEHNNGERGSNKFDRRKLEERLRRSLESKERKRADAEARVIWRAIIYRVCSTLVAQCLVQHPLTVFAHMLYGRAVLHGTGLLTFYENAPAVPLTWTAYLKFLLRGFTVETGAEQNSGVHAVEVMRSIGGFFGYEFGIVLHSIRSYSKRDAAISALVARAEERRTHRDSQSGVEAGPSAMESVELMFLSIASLFPLFTAVHFTALEKLLGFYMDVWIRIRGE